MPVALMTREEAADLVAIRRLIDAYGRGLAGKGQVPRRASAPPMRRLRTAGLEAAIRLELTGGEVAKR